MADVQNIISVDLEDWFQVEAFAGLIPRDRWETLERRLHAPTRRLLDLFEAKGIRATFFVLGWIAEREPELVQEIARRGHEIASHGWSHAALWNLDRQSFAGEAARSRQLLEQITGRPVLGFRAPTFSITRDRLWALEVLAECGYRYDSSIFPVHHDRYGIPDAPLEIHRRGDLWEVPMSVLPLGSYRLPVAGGGYFRIFPLGLTCHAIRKMNAAGRPAVVYLHPWEFDPDQPRWPGVGRLTRLRHHAGIGRNFTKLTQLVERFRFGSAAEVLEAKGMAIQV